MYIRTKKIKGKTYYYLVKTIREDGKVRQIHLDYLGTEKPSLEQAAELKKKQDNKEKKTSFQNTNPNDRATSFTA